MARSNNATGTTVNGPHPLTQGVTTFHYNTESSYNIPANARLLGVNVSGQNFLAVMEPATGFVSGGRIVVFGDHNMFTNTEIGLANNTTLAQNLVAWAAPEPGATLAIAGVALTLLGRRRRIA